MPLEFQKPSTSCIQSITDSEADDLLLQKPIAKRVTYGMRNLGNTCFFNSVMQCLSHTKPLLNFCLSQNHSKSCNKSQQCFLCFYTTYIKFIKENQKTSPNIIVQRLRTIWQRYSIGRQEDAHEFLMIFVEALMNSCFQIGKPSREFVNKNQNKTSIFKIFGGKSRSQVHCLGCNHKSNTYEDLITLSLDFPKQKGSMFGGGFQGPINIEQCLNNFCTTEVLKGDNKYFCSNCKKKSEAKKRFSIESSPRILIIHLKRFTNFGMKISSFVKYPKTLSLSTYMSSSIDSSSGANTSAQEVYDLYGVVVHQGGGCRSGHYFSYVQGAEGTDWYNCNDDFVSKVSLDVALGQQAYILFYQKRINKKESSISQSPLKMKVDQKQQSSLGGTSQKSDVQKPKQIEVKLNTNDKKAVQDVVLPLQPTVSNISTSISSSDRENSKNEDIDHSSNQTTPIKSQQSPIAKPQINGQPQISKTNLKPQIMPLNKEPHLQQTVVKSSSLNEKSNNLTQSKSQMKSEEKANAFQEKLKNINERLEESTKQSKSLVLYEPKTDSNSSQLKQSLMEQFLGINQKTEKQEKKQESPKKEQAQPIQSKTEQQPKAQEPQSSQKQIFVRVATSNDGKQESGSKQLTSQPPSKTIPVSSQAIHHVPIKRDLHPIILTSLSKKRKFEAINSLMKDERHGKLFKRFKGNVFGNNGSNTPRF